MHWYSMGPSVQRSAMRKKNVGVKIKNTKRVRRDIRETYGRSVNLPNALMSVLIAVIQYIQYQLAGP